MICHPQCFLYTTSLILLHVIKSLWSHQSIPMMGRSLEYSLVLNIFLRNHSSFVMRDLMHPPILMKHIHGLMIIYETRRLSEM
jgi:hypothetical protein